MKKKSRTKEEYNREEWDVISVRKNTKEKATTLKNKMTGELNKNMSYDSLINYLIEQHERNK